MLSYSAEPLLKGCSFFLWSLSPSQIRVRSSPSQSWVYFRICSDTWVCPGIHSIPWVCSCKVTPKCAPVLESVQEFPQTKTSTLNHESADEPIHVPELSQESAPASAPAPRASPFADLSPVSIKAEVAVPVPHTSGSLVSEPYSLHCKKKKT